jgi:hypothetical protein
MMRQPDRNASRRGPHQSRPLIADEGIFPHGRVKRHPSRSPHRRPRQHSCHRNLGGGHPARGNVFAATALDHFSLCVVRRIFHNCSRRNDDVHRRARRDVPARNHQDNGHCADKRSNNHSCRLSAQWPAGRRRFAAPRRPSPRALRTAVIGVGLRSALRAQRAPQLVVAKRPSAPGNSKTL